MTPPRLQRDLRRLPHIAWSLATLSAVGFSLVLAAQLWSMQLAPRSGYTLSNVLGEPGRTQLLLTLVLGMALPVLAGVLLLIRKGPSAADTLRRWATRLAPLSVAFVLPGLFLSDVAEAKPLFYLVVLTAFGLAARALLAASLSSLRSVRMPAVLARPQNRRLFLCWQARQLPAFGAFLLVGLAAAGYAYYLGHLAIAHHRQIAIIGEVGVADNGLANLLHRHSFRAPAYLGTPAGSYSSTHGEYGALLFLPLYAVRPGAETLLWLQACLAALCVLPLYLLAAKLVGRRTAVWASFAFLSLAPVHGALLFDFSWLPAFCLFSFTLYYAVVADRPWLSALSLTALLANGDAGAVAAFAFGWFVIFSLKRARLGTSVCLIAALVFTINARRVAPAASAAALVPFALGLKTLVGNPVFFGLDLARATKLTSMLHALAPLLLLPLAALKAAPLLLPGLLFTSGHTEFWPAARSASPFALLWIPGGVLSVLFTLRRLKEGSSQKPWYWASLVALSLVLLSHSYNFGALLRSGSYAGSGAASAFQTTPASEKRYADLQAVAARIPATARVVATPYLFSHVSNHVDAFDARGPYAVPDYVFLSSREINGESRDSLSRTFTQARYQLVTRIGEFYLFQRGVETSETAAALKTLGLLNEPNAQSQ